ncbi:MAG: STAS domain-containing protein [Trichlorobacter sp.]|nr:STAS domain-containing protein [Trichlorobacter sp.]
MDTLTLAHQQNNDGCLTVIMAGRLAIDTVAELHSFLSTKLDQAFAVKFDISDITEIDLCGVQLICAACHTALTSGKNLSFSGAVPPCFSSTVSGLGLTGSEKCKYRGDLTCIWFEGAN